MVATQAALLLEERVAGVVALSTWLGQPPKLAGAPKTGLPLLACHGGVDMFVPARFGREAKETLNRLGLATMFKTYPMMGHAFCAQVPPRAPLLRAAGPFSPAARRMPDRPCDGGLPPMPRRPVARRWTAQGSRGGPRDGPRDGPPWYGGCRSSRTRLPASKGHACQHL